MIKDALRTQLEFVHYSVHANLEGISDEESLASAEQGGNSINWVLGHMVNSRAALLELLGGEPVLGARGMELYSRHTKPIGAGSDCVPTSELLRLYDGSQEVLLEKLGEASDANLADEVPGLFDPEQEMQCGIKLAALTFHEAYHAGQLGSIRRAIGKEPAIK